MNCNHCHTSMELLREESTDRSVVRWHRCPVCGSAHMLSEPSSDSMLRLGFFHRQAPEFRAAYSTYGSAYSGPERRMARRSWLR